MVLRTGSDASPAVDNSLHLDFSGNGVFLVSTILAWQVLRKIFGD